MDVHSPKNGIEKGIDPYPHMSNMFQVQWYFLPKWNPPIGGQEQRMCLVEA